MKPTVKILLFIWFTFLLSSCSPVYEIAHDLQPPTSARGLGCIRGCQSQLNQCNNQCGVKFNQCSVKAEQQAKRLLPGLLQAYPQQLELWLNARSQHQRDLDWYELRLDMAKARRDRYVNRCLTEGKKRKACYRDYGNRFDYSLYNNRPSFNLSRPEQPTIASEASKLRNLNCDKSCACDSKYRACYSSCGGIVKSRKICIKNCPN